MATLSSMPIELLLCLLFLIDPEDLENLSLSCKPVRTKIGTELDKHMIVKRRYSIMSLNTHANQDQSIINPFEFLRAIFQDPRVALYPRILTFGDWNRDIDPATVTVVDQMSGKIDRAVHDCPYLLEADKGTWTDELQAVRHSAATALLLTLLLNLRTLVYNGGACGNFVLGCKNVGGMMTRIVEMTEEYPSNHQAFPALRKLSNIDMSSNYVFGGKRKLKLMLRLSTLPSVTRLDVNGTTCQSVLSWYTEPHVLESTEAVDISIRRSEIKSTVLKDHFIPIIKHLKQFIYHQGFFHDVCKGPLVLIQELLLTSKGTLEHLDLQTINRLHIPKPPYLRYCFSSPLSSPRQHIGILREFTVLRSICIDASSLTVEDEEERLRPQRLVDILPSSIEEVEIVGRMDSAEVEILFHELPRVKNERFPKLWGSKIVTGQWIKLAESTKAAIREAETSLFGSLSMKED